MSSHIIKNIAHKILNKNIHILYEPSYSVFDFIVLDLPFSFFLTKPLNINKSNVIFPIDLYLFNYDMIFGHNYTLKNNYDHKLHIPAIQYVHEFSNIKIESQNPNHTIVVEQLKPSRSTNFCVPIPSSQDIVDHHKEFDTVLLDCGESKLDQKIITVLKNKINNLHIIDNIAKIKDMAKYKIVIDLYPANISNLVFAISNDTYYISTPMAHIKDCVNKFNSVSLDSNLSGIIQHHDKVLKTYTTHNFDIDKQQLKNNDWNTSMTNIIQSTKHKGFYL